MNFAVITEGVSEYRIIRHIVTKYFKAQDENIEITLIQPKIVNWKQTTTGGWHEVLKCCENHDLIKEVFLYNHYLIIQIDTDQSQTKPFSISYTKPNNILKTDDELCLEVIEKLRGLIQLEILQVYRDRILFAICIHTIECWLLPLYYNNHHRSDTIKCLKPLNEALSKKGIHKIPSSSKNDPNSVRTYETILKGWKRKQDIIDSAQYNAGFRRFVDSLEALDTSITYT